MTGPSWQPGAGGMCLHTILLDPSNPDRIFVAISAAGAFRTDDGGKTWRPINQGLRSEYIPDPKAEVGHCVHRIAHAPVAPERAVHAEALGCDAQRRRRRVVARGQRQPADAISASRSTSTRTSRRRSMSSRSRATPSISRPRASCASIAAATGGNEWEALTNGLPQSDCYVNVLRDAMAVDSLDSCGVYFGTTGGQVYASADSRGHLGAHRPRSSGRPVRRSADTAMIRVGASRPFAHAGACRRRSGDRRLRAR